MLRPAAFLQPRFLYRMALLYLLLPFLLFVGFWLKPLYALLLTILLLYCAWLAFNDGSAPPDPATPLTAHQRRSWLLGAGLLLVWLLFSGVGNIAYQNFDYDIRNAVLRDLVEQPWPVTYRSTIYPPERQFTQHNLLLVYYFGYWLPSAAVGKLFGLTAANLTLLVWTFLGLLLIYSLLCLHLQKVTYKIVILLIVWSGLDILGTLYAGWATTRTVELDLLTHLERWANYFDVYAQFSSNTTLLYWVFNQTLPVWLCVLLFINGRNSRYIFLLIALSLFLAPLGTLGFLPFVAVQLGRQLYKNGASAFLRDYLSAPNTVGALAVLLISGLFFSMNRAGSMKALVFFDAFPYALFIFLEVGLLGLALYFFSRNKLILVCLGMLLFIPLIKLGRFYDFGMRASIAYLFLLSILTIRFLLDENASRSSRAFIISYLLIGSVTPFLEITRSLFFTSSHVVYRISEAMNESGRGDLIPSPLRGAIKDRPFLYDRIKTFSKYNKDIETIIDQYIGESAGNVFADYLLRKPVSMPAQPFARQ